MRGSIHHGGKRNVGGEAVGEYHRHHKQNGVASLPEEIWFFPYLRNILLCPDKKCLFPNFTRKLVEEAHSFVHRETTGTKTIFVLFGFHWNARKNMVHNNGMWNLEEAKKQIQRRQLRNTFNRKWQYTTGEREKCQPWAHVGRRGWWWTSPTMTRLAFDIKQLVERNGLICVLPDLLTIMITYVVRVRQRCWTPPAATRSPSPASVLHSPHSDCAECTQC